MLLWIYASALQIWNILKHQVKIKLILFSRREEATLQRYNIYAQLNNYTQTVMQTTLTLNLNLIHNLHVLRNSLQ